MKILKFSGRLILLYEILPYFTRGSKIKNKFSLIQSIVLKKNVILNLKMELNSLLILKKTIQ